MRLSLSWYGTTAGKGKKNGCELLIARTDDVLSWIERLDRRSHCTCTIEQETSSDPGANSDRPGRRPAHPFGKVLNDYRRLSVSQSGSLSLSGRRWSFPRCETRDAARHGMAPLPTSTLTLLLLKLATARSGFQGGPRPRPLPVPASGTCGMGRSGLPAEELVRPQTGGHGKSPQDEGPAPGPPVSNRWSRRSGSGTTWHPEAWRRRQGLPRRRTDRSRPRR
jgi:hypothetical protein